MIFDNYKEFIQNIYKNLESFGINTQDLKINHIGYQADSSDNYDRLIDLLGKNTELISESCVGDRRVGILKLDQNLEYKDQVFNIIEIVEPKQGQEVQSSWEHVEFLVNTSLEEFMQKYPDVKWDSTVLNREEFPMLILSFEDGTRAKFPRLGVLEELERQKKN